MRASSSAGASGTARGPVVTALTTTVPTAKQAAAPRNSITAVPSDRTAPAPRGLAQDDQPDTDPAGEQAEDLRGRSRSPRNPAARAATSSGWA